MSRPKGLLLIILENGLNREKRFNRALWVMRFAAHTSWKIIPFEKHCGRKSRTVHTKTFNKALILLLDWYSVCVLRTPEKIETYVMREGNCNVTNDLVKAKKRSWYTSRNPDEFGNGNIKLAKTQSVQNSLPRGTTSKKISMVNIKPCNKNLFGNVSYCSNPK